MNKQRWRTGSVRIFVGLLCLNICGCLSRYHFQALENGYEERVVYSGMIHGGWHRDLLYTSRDGQRQTVMRHLSSTSYNFGDYAIHEDMIVFPAQLFDPYHGAPIPQHLVVGYDAERLPHSLAANAFAAEAGSPPVEITRSAFRKAVQAQGQSLSGKPYRFSRMERTETGIRVRFTRWLERQDLPAELETTLTWPELRDLIRSIQASGRRYSFEGATYYVRE